MGKGHTDDKLGDSQNAVGVSMSACWVQVAGLAVPWGLLAAQEADAGTKSARVESVSCRMEGECQPASHCTLVTELIKTSEEHWVWILWVRWQ